MDRDDDVVNFAFNQIRYRFSLISSFGYVIKELVHAFSRASIELWMHLGSWESTREAGVALLRFSLHVAHARAASWET